MTPHHAAHSVRPIWRVGFSGHRNLPAESKIAAALSAVWIQLREKVEGDLEAYTSGAQGGDILFLESAARAGVNSHIIFPFRKSLFLEDVALEWRPRLDAAIAAASSVEEGFFSNDRNEAFYACGIAVLDASDIMVFCWDGKPARGHGGTADIIAVARERNLPLLIINADSGAISSENFQSEKLHDPAADELNELIEHHLPAHWDATKSTALDEVASRCAPIYRLFSTLNIVVHVIAITVAVLGLKYALGDFAPWVKVGLLGITIGLFIYVSHVRLHDAWLSCRVAAELERSLKVCGGLLELSKVESLLRLFPAHSRIARAFSRQAQLNAKSLDFPARKTLYIEQRLVDQRNFFEKTIAKLDGQNLFLISAFWTCSLSGFVTAIVYAVDHHYAWLGPATAILPVLAMMFLAVMATLDVDRRLQRFREMRDEVDRAISRVSATRDLPALSREIASAEQTLLGEVAEWFRRTRHLHIH